MSIGNPNEMFLTTEEVEPYMKKAKARMVDPNTKHGEVSSTFDRDTFEAILANDKCTGIRIYRVLKDGKRQMILVGVDAQHRDIPSTYANRGFDCPPLCVGDCEV